MTSSLYMKIMERLQLSPSVLDWAAAEAGLSLSSLALKLSKRNADDILEGRLTEPQVERFAQLTGIPLGFLFRTEPPAPRDPGIVDFRTSVKAKPLSRNFFDSLDEVQYKQDWYREYMESIGAPALEFVGKYAQRNANALEVAQDIRRHLDINNLDRHNLQSPDDLYATLVERIEGLGVLVFKNGVVGNNTRRPLSVDEFRGFVLSDPLAPVIFINGSDAAAAWVFTLIHELAHIWLGDSGISDTRPGTDIQREALCNAIAAETLVPENNFQVFWNSSLARGDWTSEHIISMGRLHFRVSELVIARRAYDLGLVDYKTYNNAYAHSQRASRKSPGGDFYRTAMVRNSKKFSNRVASLAVSGSISFREAGRLLSIAPGRVETIYKKHRALST